MAVRTFRTFVEGEKPDLVPVGIPPFDDKIGGLFPGTVGILAMKTGVGKSRLKLTAALHNAEHNGVHTGLIELEDPEDVVGCRSLAWASGVDSLRIRRKDLLPPDVEALQRGRAKLQSLSGHVSLRYNIGAPMEDVTRAVEELAEAGARIVWLDWIGKIRGGGGDRRNEVGGNFTAFQRACDKFGVVGMAISQVRRLPDDNAPIGIHHLKESGDLENESRLVILGDQDRHDPGIINVRIAKSTYGGVGARCSYITDETGNLRLMTDDDERRHAQSDEEDYEDI